MLRSPRRDATVTGKKLLRVTSIMGFAMILGQAQLGFAQEAPVPPPPTTSPPSGQASPPPAAPVIPPAKNEVSLTPPAPVVQPRNEAPPPPAPSAVPKQAHSVAVLDLGIRQEHQDFFYDEKHSAKSSTKKKKRSGVDMQSADDASLADPARHAQMADEDAQSESSYAKQYGYKRRVSYNEVRGLMTEVRMALKQAGYTVIQPHGLFSKQMEIGEIPSIKDRLAAGDFGNAQYVLIPNVVDASVRETQEPVQGTSEYARRYEMNLTVEFTMVNTETQAVMASFNASGYGSDMYLGKAYAKFVPDTAMVKRNMLTTFGADARKKLLAQLPKPGADGSLEAKPGTPSSGSFADGDPKTLKVYRVNESQKEVTKDGASSEKKKEEIRIYRQ